MFRNHPTPPQGLIALFGLMAALGAAPLAAEATLNANDLTVGTLSAPSTYEGFALLARADKTVVVEAVDEGRTAADGEVFNARIKLGGAGGPKFRAVKFTTPGGLLVVYCNSSSKTDARGLRVADEAGAVVADLVAPVDGAAGRVECPLPAGTFLVYSTSGGVNLYQVTVR